MSRSPREWPERDQAEVRADVFRWLDEKLLSGQSEFTRSELENYHFRGSRLPLLDRNRGIRNPKELSATLTVMTSVKKTVYEDEVRPDGYVRYSYQSADGGDNRKLSAAFHRGDPIVYFKGVRPGVFVAYYPAYVVHSDPVARHVYLALDESFRFFADPLRLTDDQRRYAERVTRQRLHQPMFRAWVMRAYKESCAVCELRHPALLDAAHIIGDSHADGFAQIENGIALCKLHHASYDRNLLGVTPGYLVEVNEGIRGENDGSMLRYGLQDMHGRRLQLPRNVREWPSPDRLALRYAEFQSG